MHIEKATIQNFRLLRNSALDLDKALSLLVGKNNSGKTSLLVLFEKFYRNESFTFNDFSTSIRDKLRNFTPETDVNELSIKLIIELRYDGSDNLENLSELILDLDPTIRTVKILFECGIGQRSLLKNLESVEAKDKKRWIEKNLHSYLSSDVYVFENDSDLEPKNRHRLVKKKIETVKKVINLQVIHAKRDVTSSEGRQSLGENRHGSGNVLSKLTTKYFNNKNRDKFTDLKKINELMITMDDSLDKSYEDFFQTFLSNARDFLDVDNLKVASNLESKGLLATASHVVYGAEGDYLPEHLNGLGYMNILYLLLSIEIAKDEFVTNEGDLNLLFIEEPEAHTHPQMQYVFSKKIKKLLEGVPNLQTVITTHSAHIVSQCNFGDVRYLLKKSDPIFGDNIEIKNFDSELKKTYKQPDDFKFLKEYLTLQSAELFFANKVVFIEGVSERILLPYFIHKFDAEMGPEKALGSQNISILEVGANAKVFQAFLNFLEVKTLILTDFDTVKLTNATSGTRKVHSACQVSEGTTTSNATLKHFFKAPEPKEEAKHQKWFEELRAGELSIEDKTINVFYQLREGDYHARSFEDAFIASNKNLLKENKESLWGIKNVDELDHDADIYHLAQNVINKKSDFAASILFQAFSKKVEWAIPSYIKQGLSWLAS